MAEKCLTMLTKGMFANNANSSKVARCAEESRRERCGTIVRGYFPAVGGNLVV